MITLEQIQEYLPKYLSPKQQQDLAAQLRDFENRSYYTNLHETEMLQGDGWTKIEIVDLTTGTRDKIKGILLSNSCDIAASNVREFPPRIVFAPLIPLHAHETRRYVDCRRAGSRLRLHGHRPCCRHAHVLCLLK